MSTTWDDLCRPATRHYNRQRLPITAVLRGLASQENCDGEEHDLMITAAELLDRLKGMAHASPELNMSNYTPDEVSQLNDAMNELCEVLRQATESDRVLPVNPNNQE